MLLVRASSCRKRNRSPGCARCTHPVSAAKRYGIELTFRANRDPDRLPAKIGFACLEFIYGAVAGNPQRVGKAVLYPLDGQFSARRGSYRVVYRVDDDRSVVLINRIDHRADVFCM